MAFYAPIMYKDNSHRLPVISDDYIDNNYILISDNANSFLKRNNITGALEATSDGVLPTDPTGSGLRTDTNGKLYVYIPDLIESAADNLIKLGVNNKLYVSGQGLIATGPGSNLTYDSNGRLRVDPSKLLSADLPNFLGLGSDGGLLLANSAQVSASDKYLTQEADGLKNNFDLVFDGTTDNLNIIGKGGQVVKSVNLAIGVLGFRSITIEENPSGQPAGTYMVIVYSTDTGDQTVYVNMTDFLNIYAPSNAGISISGLNIGAVADATQGFAVGANGIGAASGYALMTTAEKTKLAGIAPGAGVAPVTSVNSKLGDVVLTKTDIGLANVDNTADVNKPISTAVAGALAAKQATITGAASTGVTNNFAVGMAMVTDGNGKMAASPNVTATELGYLDGVTGPLQTQVNNILNGSTPVAPTIATKTTLGQLIVGDGLTVDATGKTDLALVEDTPLIISGSELGFDPTQMSAAGLKALQASLQVPIRLTANTTWYVDGTNGSDSYTVADIPTKAQTQATAFRTIQAAIDFVCGNFFAATSISTITISVAAGTYDEHVELWLPHGDDSQVNLLMSIEGVAGYRTAVINGGFTSFYGGYYQLSGFYVNGGVRRPAWSGNYYGIFASNLTEIAIRDMTIDMGNMTGKNGGAVRAGERGYIHLLDNLTLRADNIDSYIAAIGGMIHMGADTTINFAGAGGVGPGSTIHATIYVTAYGLLSIIPASVLTGAPVGDRYDAYQYGIIRTNGSGPNKIPGTLPGGASSPYGYYS